MPAWSPLSWNRYAYRQAATYPDNAKLHRVLEQLGQLPPLVTYGEIKHLKHTIARAGRGEPLSFTAKWTTI